MPTYEFTCDKCGSTIDVFRGMYQANDPVKCECGEMMRRVFTVPGAIQVKGPGTDDARRKKAEDQLIGRKVKRAKELKAKGKVPMDAIIKLEDKDIQD